MAESQTVAKQALKKLEDQLTCAVCLDAFKDPKMLHCFHVFCKDCLQQLLKQLDARCTEITDQRALVEANIHKEIQSFIEMLKVREVELVSQLDQLVQPKLKNLAAQRDEIETIQAAACHL